MLGRAGISRSLLSAIAGLTGVRIWFYQDFVAGSGPGITLSQNDNGTGGAAWSSAKIVNSSAVVTDTDGNPIYSNAAGLPSQEVYVSAHTSTAVTLNAAPDASYGTVRVWYLYQDDASNMPTSLLIAPQLVYKARADYMDGRFLNSALNLSDLASAATARTNLGFSSQTTGQVLYGNGSSTFASDANLFWDSSNKLLGLFTSSPTSRLHINDTGANAVAAQFTNSVSGALIGDGMLVGLDASANGVINQRENLDIIFSTNNTEILRLKANGTLDTTLGAGAVQSNSSGILSSSTLGISLGGTGQTTASAAFDALSPMTTAGDIIYGGASGTGTRLATGTANKLLGVNAGATAPEYKAVTITLAGTLTIPGGQVLLLPAGAVNATSLAFTGSLGSGLYSPNTDQAAIAAGGVQGLLATATLVTLPLATLFKTSIQLEDPGAGTNKITLQSPTLSGDYTLTLPTAQGSAGFALTNNGSGVLSWSKIPTFKSGTVDLVSGSIGVPSTKAISFATDFGTANYRIFVSFKNITDSSVLMFTYEIIAQASTGFTIQINDSADSANYSMQWFAVGDYDP